METANITLKPLRLGAPRSLAHLVVERLREAIIDGEFALGAMIPEEALAQGFGVSRTPVREAINQLQLQGVVVVKPQRGSYVFMPTGDDITAICQFRCVLEPRAAEMAHAHDLAGTLQTLDAAIDEMAQAMAEQDPVRYGRADTRLHEAFFQHCGNPYLQASYATAATKIATLRTHLSAPADVLDPQGFQQHSCMRNQFARGDFAALERQLVEHITASRDHYVAKLQARQ